MSRPWKCTQILVHSYEITEHKNPEDGSSRCSKMLVKRTGVPSVPQRQTGWLEVQLHLFQTLATQRDEWLISCSCCFTHGEKNTQYLLRIGLAGPKRWSGRFGTQENLLYLLELNPRSSRSQPSHYTDWATQFPWNVGTNSEAAMYLSNYDL